MSASKKEALIQNALKSFYRGGFQAVGMDRLARETGVSKTAIYKHFDTKEDLILATLRLRDDQFRNWLETRGRELAARNKSSLLGLFEALGEWFQTPEYQSCLFVKAASEYQDRNHPVHKAAAEHKHALLRLFEQIASQDGIADAKLVAKRLLLIKEGAIVMAFLHDPQDVARDALATARECIHHYAKESRGAQLAVN